MLLMGKLTISMAIFNSYVKLPEGKSPFSYGFPMVFPFSYGLPYRPKPFFEVEDRNGSKSRNDQPLVLRSRAPGNPPGDG